MPYARVWIHFVWSTKNRAPGIHPQLKPELLAHIKFNAGAKGIFIDCLNCVADHIHLLVSLGREQSVSEVARLIKGESAHWVNKNNKTTGRFEWQTEYFAVSVSESLVGKVRHYIARQEEHHRNKTFDDEWIVLSKAYGFAPML